jgi:glycine/D-amino acid oxidase-like deaminating enzyme
VPNSNGTANRLGATYEWHDLTLESNQTQRQALIDSYQKHAREPAHFGKSQVGIRPTTRDRQPFVGKLTNLDQAYCFNGFGSKGCLTVPYHAEAFADHLLNQAPLADELTRWL